MSQDKTIRMVTKGDDAGVGKNHTYYVRFNAKNKKDQNKKFQLKKFNPVAKKHTIYTEKK